MPSPSKSFACISGPALAMAFKLLTMAEKRWRKINTAHLVPLVQAGVKFPDGKTRTLPDLLSDIAVNLPMDTALETAIHNIWQYLHETRFKVNIK